MKVTSHRSEVVHQIELQLTADEMNHLVMAYDYTHMWQHTSLAVAHSLIAAITEGLNQ